MVMRLVSLCEGEGCFYEGSGGEDGGQVECSG